MKTYFLCSLFFVLCTITSIAKSDVSDMDHYIGTDFQFKYMKNHINMDSKVAGINILSTDNNNTPTPDRIKYNIHPQISIFSGVKFNDTYGAEVGYNFSRSSRYKGINERFKMGSHYAGLTVSTPIGIFDDFYGIGLAGVSHIKLKFDGNSTTDVIPRASVGLLKHVDEDFGMRLTATWEDTSRIRNANNIMKDSMNYGLGVLYKF